MVISNLNSFQDTRYGGASSAPSPQAAPSISSLLVKMNLFSIVRAKGAIHHVTHLIP